MESKDAGVSKPLLVFDGGCDFCRRWIARWKQVTGDRVEYAPSQEVGTRFSQVSKASFAGAVHLVEPDGRISSGAEAVFRALAYAPGRGGWLWVYRHVPGFSGLSEWCYRLVAGHRPAFSRLTDLVWGAHVLPPGEGLTCWLFIRLLAIVYMIAIVSLWTQIQGLVGSGGILPADAFMRALAQAESLGFKRYWLAPTLCWISSGDWFLNALCAGGVALAAGLALGFAPTLCLFGLWAIYLSLATVCRDFLWFQWDGLLLETGFISMFLVSRGWWSSPRTDPGPARGALRLSRWLLFRLLFASAAVKLGSGDPAWRDLTALSYHYETQPLPPWTAWYAHHLPLWVHRMATGATLLVEGAVAFLIFAPRKIRIAGAALIAAHQLLIAVTGNYGFFNGLVLTLCILLLDDGVWPSVLRRRLSPAPDTVPRARPWPVWIRRPVLAGLFLLSLVPLLDSVGGPAARLGPLPLAYEVVSPFRTVNHYGLFAIMTQERPEILIQGSVDGADWRTYEFRYKPGEPTKTPPFVAPHQPRLDWQMWFAALSDFQHERWLLSLCDKLLRNSAPVLNLFAENPFPGAPPRYIRAVLYRYHFTDPAARRATGAWWRREPLGLYCPVLTLEAGRLAAAPPELQR